MSKKETALVTAMKPSLQISTEKEAYKLFSDYAVNTKEFTFRLSYTLGKLYSGNAHKNAKVDNFKDYLAQRFPSDKFGISPERMQQLARVGAEFLKENDVGNIEVTLPEKDGKPWSISTLEKLLPLGKSGAEHLVTDGKLSSATSQQDAVTVITEAKNARKNGKPHVVTLWKHGDESMTEEEIRSNIKQSKHSAVFKDGDKLVTVETIFSESAEPSVISTVWNKVKPEPKYKLDGTGKGLTVEQAVAALLKSFTPEQIAEAMKK